MLGESWPDDTVEIFITCSGDENCILKMMKKYLIHQSKHIMGNLVFYCRYYCVNGYDIIVRLCGSKNFDRDVQGYLLFCDYHVRNNIYHVASNELQIDTMHEIFMKQTNLPNDDVDSDIYLEYFYRKDFAFYRSKEDKRIFSNEELLNRRYTVVNMQKNFSKLVVHIDTTIVIKNNLIYFTSIMCPPVHIINKDILDSTAPLHIRTCKDHSCYATMLGTDPQHFHCEDSQPENDYYYLLVWK